jgi:hypothetical protein
VIELTIGRQLEPVPVAHRRVNPAIDHRKDVLEMLLDDIASLSSVFMS